jgi:hypothetical protein
MSVLLIRRFRVRAPDAPPVLTCGAAVRYGPTSGRVVEATIRFLGAQNVQDAQDIVTLGNASQRDEPVQRHGSGTHEAVHDEPAYSPVHARSDAAGAALI